MFLKKPDLTAGSRPTLADDETLLVVQDGVGLYEGCENQSTGDVLISMLTSIPANTRLLAARKAMPI